LFGMVQCDVERGDCSLESRNRGEVRARAVRVIYCNKLTGGEKRAIEICMQCNAGIRIRSARGVMELGAAARPYRYVEIAFQVLLSGVKSAC